MAFNLFGGKRRITKGFFANSLGNKQTRGIYTFQIDVENGELIFKKYFVTPTDPLAQAWIYVLPLSVTREASAKVSAVAA